MTIQAPADLSSERLRRVIDTMFPPASSAHTEAGIGLGAGYATPFVAEKILALFDEGLIDHVFLCGGRVINDIPETAFFKPALDPLLTAKKLRLPEPGETEADYLKNFLLEHDIPAERMTVENASTNTAENLRNAFMTDAFKDRDPQTLNLIGLLPSRAFDTLPVIEDELGLAYRIAIVTNVIPLPQEPAFLMENVPFVRGFVLAEYEKIDPENPGNYFNKGFCIPRDIPFELKRAAELLLSQPQSKNGVKPVNPDRAP